MPNLIYYFLALAVWGLTILIVPGDEYSETGLFGEPLHLYLPLASVGTALLVWLASRFFKRDVRLGGAALTGLMVTVLAAGAFYLSMIGDFYLITDQGELRPHLFTPIWCAVFGLFFCLRYNWSLFALVFFTVVVSYAHLYAINAAAFVYDDVSPMIDDIAIGGVTLAGAYIVPGFVGGFLGTVLSLLGLSIIKPGYRNILLIMSAAVVLGVLGATGLATPEETPPAPAFWLYLPWQLVFGWIVVTGVRRG